VRTPIWTDIKPDQEKLIVLLVKILSVSMTAQKPLAVLFVAGKEKEKFLSFILLITTLKRLGPGPAKYHHFSLKNQPNPPENQPNI